jgi:hypothetical protein
MNLKIKGMIGIFLLSFTLESYAIRIDVQTSKDTGVKALGFTVNGKSYGGRCCTYNKTNMPAGNYSFGVRVGSLIGGTDISCVTRRRNPTVMLNTDSIATLSYANNKCKLNIVSQGKKLH